MTNIISSATIFLCRIFAYLPLGVTYRISDIIYPLVRHMLKYRRKVVRRNLRNSFPGMEETWYDSVEAGFYRHLCDCIMETIKLLHISDEEMRRRVTIRNVELIEDIAKENRPIILFLGHYGNWEWVQEITRRYTTPEVSGEIYRPISSRIGSMLMERIRSRYSTRLIPQKTAVRTIIGMRQQHGTFLIGFISDQRPIRRSLNHWTHFLNQETPYMVGGEEIGRHIGAAFLYLDIEKPRRGHYIMTVKDMRPSDTEQEYPYTLLYMQMLEATIKRAPQYWLWTHKRWKHKREKQ
ncbi:MAG: lysophospholipid acyltransferase family protein [Bacteroides sp.]|nr:lysophospholipid acyltransferase family protein [Roseburia sp.]MCM1345822.1 lysophospholipid acyltransferase family protein [Bacteroides sp.]MCM1421287.1 lysophospholipid acyltransferase family protein [Bacteroides sp.]